MGKSSLGKRKTSVCPVRLSSLGTVGEVPERSTRQSRSSVKKSLIPRPSRNRTQSSSPAKDAAKCVSTALRPSRSNSNLQHIGTPMTPMCWLGSIPRTAQSTRSTVFDSRGPGLHSKPVLKDSRPLSDKQFQNASVQKVQSYLLQMGDRDFTPSTSKALSTRSLTLKMFVELTSRLLSHFFPKHIINMSNYADEIPLLTKKLGYPGSVKKSWLITANSSHSWLNVVGLLSWLVDVFRIVRHEKLMNIMFSDEVDEEMPENFMDSKTMLSYYFKCYELFNKEDSDNMAVQDSWLYQEMEEKCNVNDKDLMSMREESEKLKIQVEAAVEEGEAAQAALIEVERAVTGFQSDRKKKQHSVQEKYTYIGQLEDISNKHLSKIHWCSESIENKKAENLRLRHTVDNQTVTLEDKRRIETERRELEESLDMEQNYNDTYLKSVYADDLQLAKITNESKNKAVAYSATLIEYSNMLPALNLLNMPVNALHRDADKTMQGILDQVDSIEAEIKAKLNELETFFEENEKAERQAVEVKFTASEEYNNTARRVEDLQIEHANMKEEVKQEKHRMKCDLKRVQDECPNRAEISSALQEEAHKLKERKETSQLIEDHILDVAAQIRAYFADLDAIYADVIKKMKLRDEVLGKSSENAHE